MRLGNIVESLQERQDAPAAPRGKGHDGPKGKTLQFLQGDDVPLVPPEASLQQMKKAGAPIDYFYLDPVIVHPVGMGISKRAPHPNAAALFFDFILTEGQKIYLEQQSYPSNVKIKPLPQGVELHVIDFARALDEQDKWSKIYKDTFLARPR